MTALGAVLWIVEIVNAADSYRLDRFGLRPRDIDGLVGIVTMPFLHASFAHLLGNTAPFIFIGWAVLLSGVRPFVVSSGVVIVIGGLVTWLIAPSVGPHGGVVGASALIMGWLGYLLGRAYFSRRILWIIVAVAVVFFFGTLLGGLFPSVGSEISWQGHLAGFAAGVFAAWLMHPRRRSTPRRGRNTGDIAPASAQPLS
jgi:membrane associated rhomboid family serine protease